MVEFTTVSHPDQVRQILELQQRNHSSVLTAQDQQREGFVTVQHQPEVLQQMNALYPSVIAVEAGVVVGYCLMMPRSFSEQVPELIPMFDMFDALLYKGRPLSEQNWFVMGQVCVAASHRGMGVFDGMYNALKHAYAADFDFVITEIAQRNTRSQRAHERVGFSTLHSYREDPGGETWNVVVWDWR